MDVLDTEGAGFKLGVDTDINGSHSRIPSVTTLVITVPAACHLCTPIKSKSPGRPESAGGFAVRLGGV